MTRSGLALAAALFAAAPAARADSPLTSIDLSAGYDDVRAVKAARSAKGLKGAALEFVLSTEPPIDQRIAVACAAGWGKANAEAYLQAFAKARQLDPARLEAKDLTSADLFLVGYLAAMDRYLDLKPIQAGANGVRGLTPLQLVDQGAADFPNDFAIQYTRALVQAQAKLDGKWCEVYRIPKAVLDRFPAEKRDLRPQALRVASDYLSLYEKDCPNSKAAKDESRAQLNQIYSLARVGSQLVAGTQGGVVVWDVARVDKPVAVHQEFICNVVAWSGMAWAGCDKSVVSWDGKVWRKYLLNKANDAEYYRPMLGPDGALWVRYGQQTFAFDKAGDKFKPVQPPWRGNVYDALVTKDGEIWWIDFLNSLSNRQKSWPLRSEEYPGSDPRQFEEDSAGRLWVEDFAGGLFRFEPSTGRFVHEEGLDKKGTGVAFDLKTERLWMLHYTEGPLLKANGRVQRSFDLRQDGSMRDMLLDQDGSVWVGSHSGVVRLRERDGGEWTEERLIAR